MKKLNLVLLIAVVSIMAVGYTTKAMAQFVGKVEAVTDQEVYSVRDSITVMAKFTNPGTLSELIYIPSPGGINATVQIFAAGGSAKVNPTVLYSGTMALAYPTNPVVEGSSSVIATYLKIPAGKLTAGTYVVDIIFRVLSATNPPQMVFLARPYKLIVVK